MTSAAQLRKASLAQTGAAQVEADGTRGWDVDGTRFAWLEADGRARLRLAGADARRMAAELDGVDPVRGGVRIDLAAINGMALNHWVHEAWKHTAPRTLAEAAARAARQASAADDDLGRIGAPARRALHGAGIGSLDDLLRRDRSEVEALHGIGPRAVDVLAEALAARGDRW